MGYSFRITAGVLLCAPPHRQDSTYHSLCYTSRGALAGKINGSMGPPHEGWIRRPIAPWANSLTMELHLAPKLEKIYQYLFNVYKNKQKIMSWHACHKIEDRLYWLMVSEQASMLSQAQYLHLHDIRASNTFYYNVITILAGQDA